MSPALVATLPLLAASRPALGFLEGIGGMEMMLVVLIGLLLFGGKGLPDMARTLGRVTREFRKATSAVEDEVKRAMAEEPPRPPAPQPRPPATVVRLEGPAEAPPAALPPPPAPPPPAA